jgi:hypothetical protein
MIHYFIDLEETNIPFQSNVLVMNPYSLVISENSIKEFTILKNDKKFQKSSKIIFDEEFENVNFKQMNTIQLQNFWNLLRKHIDLPLSNYKQVILEGISRLCTNDQTKNEEFLQGISYVDIDARLSYRSFKFL